MKPERIQEPTPRHPATLDLPKGWEERVEGLVFAADGEDADLLNQFFAVALAEAGELPITLHRRLLRGEIVIHVAGEIVGDEALAYAAWITTVAGSMGTGPGLGAAEAQEPPA